MYSAGTSASFCTCLLSFSKSIQDNTINISDNARIIIKNKDAEKITAQSLFPIIDLKVILQSMYSSVKLVLFLVLLRFHNALLRVVVAVALKSSSTRKAVGISFNRGLKISFSIIKKITDHIL